MIPIADPDLGAAEKTRITDIIESGMLADGPAVRQFEDAFATFCGADRAVATSNGTTALHAAFKALDIGDGDRVVTTPFSFIASANAIRHVGAEPVFADICPETYTLDPEAVEETIRHYDGEVEALLVVHLYGLPAEMDELIEIADYYDLKLIEDAAQAHGAEFAGERVGSIGDVGCFSFYPTKNMTTGEGGMIVTNDENVADRAARFINHGRSADGTHVSVGHNFRMTSIAGAIGLAQLRKLPDNTDRRRENATMLTDGLADSPVQTPIEPNGTRHVYHQYTIRFGDRAKLLSVLEENEIGYGIYYPRAIHQQQAYANVDVSLSVAEQVAEEVLSLPVHPGVGETDIERILQVVSNV